MRGEGRLCHGRAAFAVDPIHRQRLRGRPLAPRGRERAKQLDPFYPSWYHNGEFHDQYRRHRYAEALAAAKRVNLPDFIQAHTQLVSVYGQLGRISEAQPHIKRIFEIDPTFDAHKHWEIRLRFQPESLEQILDGMRKAGMKIREKNS